MEIHRESKAPKLKYPDGVVSPIDARNLDHGRRRNALFDPYASDSSDSPSPLLKYLRSAESNSFSSPKFVTPVKFEEDVFVMDGIPVKKSCKGSGEARKRSTLMPSSSFNSNYSGGRSNSTPSKSYRGGVIENIKLHKNRLCSFWETCGTCQFGSECQFAHGKEELQRPPRSSGKILLEVRIQIKPNLVVLSLVTVDCFTIFKSNNNLEGSASPSYGKNCSANIQSKPSPSPSPSPSSATEEKAISLPSSPAAMAFSTPPPVQIKHLSGSAITSSTPPRRSDWTPQDDGIEVTLPFAEGKSPSEEDVNAYIEKVLSGITSRKRLPVFVEIFPG